MLPDHRVNFRLPDEEVYVAKSIHAPVAQADILQGEESRRR